MKTSKPGSQMGTKSRAILECLRQNGGKNRFDLEILLNMGPLIKALDRLRQVAYICRTAHGGKNVGIYDITRQGRQALGESLELPAPREIRFCNASMTGIYVPAIHNTSRIGVARA
jgi:hypothetical protein